MSYFFVAVARGLAAGFARAVEGFFVGAAFGACFFSIAEITLFSLAFVAASFLFTFDSLAFSFFFFIYSIPLLIDRQWPSIVQDHA